ncbi:hypothetical protein BDW02DRAFT_374363 [Decorospora gaudefroyi]|uniref:Uncharacterized protein n=1 Tax=Decorospora gaudefroyi TaxID=184978 RepID=A0A6A5KCU6_9PLEO|nr:hypothetical protein BDW02DRAFT_374363 [Decorospora gaudefroyi]
MGEGCVGAQNDSVDGGWWTRSGWTRGATASGDGQGRGVGSGPPGEPQPSMSSPQVSSLGPVEVVPVPIATTRHRSVLMPDDAADKDCPGRGFLLHVCACRSFPWLLLASFFLLCPATHLLRHTQPRMPGLSTAAYRPQGHGLDLPHINVSPWFLLAAE